MLDDYIKRSNAINALDSLVWSSSADHTRKNTLTAVMRLLPPADVVEVGKWYDIRGYIIELQADENGHDEFFRIIKLDDKLNERIAGEIEKVILYGERAEP